MNTYEIDDWDAEVAKLSPEEKKALFGRFDTVYRAKLYQQLPTDIVGEILPGNLKIKNITFGLSDTAHQTLKGRFSHS